MTDADLIMGSKNWYFEDFAKGDSITTSARTITETDIVLTVGITGHFQPLFTDEEFAKKTPYGTRIAPGELTIGILAGLIARKGLLENQIGLLELNSKFPHAVRAGDTLHAVIEILDTRKTSKSDRGIVIFKDLLINQRGEIALETRRTAMFFTKGHQ